MPTQTADYLKQELKIALNENSEIFDWIDHHVLDGLWYRDLENPDNEWFSPTLLSTLGYQEGEVPLLAHWWQSHLFSEDKNRVIDNYNKYLADPQLPYDQVVKYKHKNGSVVWVRCRGLIIRNDLGKPIRMLGAHSNITQLLQTQSELENLSESLSRKNEIADLAIKASNIGIWEWHCHAEHQYWNAEMFETYELDGIEGDVPHAVWINMLHIDDRERVLAEFNSALSKNDDFESSFRVVTAKGKLKTVRMLGSVFSDESGQAERILGANWDTTEQTRERKALERSNHELSKFVQVASHDLRSPLNGIYNLASWIEEDHAEQLPGEALDYLKTMQGRILRMRNLLDDLVNYARLDMSVCEPELLDISLFVQDVVSLMASNKKINVDFSAGSLTQMRLPRVSFELVMRNIISNAIKHIEEGHLELMLNCYQEGNFNIIEVTDNGPGIPSQFQQRVTEMFTTLKPKDQVEGSGMGLALIKKTVEFYGGELNVISDGIKGTTIKTSWLTNLNVETINE